MLTRIISGIIGMIIATGVIQIGGSLFIAVSILLACLAWREYVNAFAHKNYNIHCLGLLIICFMVLSGYMANNIVFGIVVAIFVSLMNMIFNHKHFFCVRWLHYLSRNNVYSYSFLSFNNA